MLEKHLAHLKKPGHGGMDPMIPPQVHALNSGSARQSMKDEESPAKSPATTSNWNSPNQVPGVSPVASSTTDEYMTGPQSHHGLYAVQSHMASNQMVAGYNTTSQLQMQQRHGNHRRQISDISGGADDGAHTPKRQQISYVPPVMQLPNSMGHMPRPR